MSVPCALCNHPCILSAFIVAWSLPRQCPDQRHAQALQCIEARESKDVGDSEATQKHNHLPHLLRARSQAPCCKQCLINVCVVHSSNAWVDAMLGVGGKGGELSTAQCPDGQAAVGYTAAPSCSGLNQLQVCLHQLYRGTSHLTPLTCSQCLFPIRRGQFS